MDHDFTKEIKKILKEDFGELYEEIYKGSYLIQYLNIKTRSANKGSKSRGANQGGHLPITTQYMFWLKIILFMDL